MRRREFGQEVWKAFTRSFGPLVFVWFDSIAYRVAVPSVAHVCERLGSMRRGQSLTHQRIKTRTFHLINAQTLKAHPYPNPSRH